MKVFVAGASGTIGVPLVRALVASGHQVFAMTRSPEKQQSLRALGATPIVADALDASALTQALINARPEVVIHQLTNLPKTGVRSAKDLESTNRLRIEGTRNLIDAAVAAKAKRIIGASFVMLLAAKPDENGRLEDGAAAMQSMESQIVEASRSGRIEGIVLRYGMWYGPANPMTQQMIWMAKRRLLPVVKGDRSLLPVLHLDDAVAAALVALDHGVPGTIYDIVDDQPVSMTDIVRELATRARAPRPLTVPSWIPRLLSPYMARVTSVRLPVSNAKARAELGWRPLYPTMRDGLARTMTNAA
jgi:nucleoside-diphosphate-sugar epimerase